MSLHILQNKILQFVNQLIKIWTFEADIIHMLSLMDYTKLRPGAEITS